jgi:hypothetical protein
MRFLSLRAVFLLGFVVTMPVLALPAVARRIDELLYGSPPTDFGRPPAPAPLLDEPVAPKMAGLVSPARYEETSLAAAYGSTAPVATPSSPPPLAAAPEFSPASLPPTSANPPAPEPKIDEAVLARLQQIRQRLEDLGAEYVIVETQDSGRFRFHCRMIVDERSRFTRPFEASSFDAVAAGEQVVREVEAWRAAAGDVRTAAVR